MEKEQAARVHQLFEQALEREAGERAAFLEDACAGDSELYARVEALLAADEGADTFFADFARRAGLPHGTNPEPRADGDRIGPYRILREIGCGGMGVVYLAQRDDGQFDQTVALKLIRSGGDREAVRRRFLRERQILARLNHPGIARIYDGGVTDNGEPWFAMEYVEGEPIDRFCDARRLDVDARLRLFRDVCRAVQYAHGNLVVHRDLKPGNILVTDTGAVKLLDFGIARPLDASGDLELTQTSARILTPAWSSPEQVRGDDVTTATDVYALGLVLYELLTGRRAHRASDPDTLTREIVERAPSRPSAVIEHPAGEDPKAETAPAAVAAARSIGPARLSRRLSGDLDTICLTALRKEPERRYASAEGLVQDIDRHLDGLPILARPDTVAYRLGKFIRRNRAAVVAGALVVLALAAGLVAALWQAQAVARERDTAETVTAFMIDLFETSDPSVSRGEEVTARELLDRGAERVERQLAGRPEVQARMLGAVGQVYVQLGLYDRALPLLQRVLAHERSAGTDAAELATTAALLGKALEATGDPDSARAHYEEALRLRRARFGDAHPAVAESLFDLASLLHASGERARGDTLFEQWIAMQERLPETPSTAQAARLLQTGSYLRAKQRFEEAERYMRSALAMSRSLHGDQHPSVGSALLDLAGLLQSTDRLDEAERLYRDAWRVNRTLYPDGHAQTLTSLMGLAAVARRQQRLEVADSLLRAAIDMAPRAIGPGDFRWATLYYNRGQVRYALQRYEGARSDFARAAGIWAELLGEGSAYVLHATAGQAHALRDAGRYDEAEPLYLAAERGYVDQYGEESALVGATKLNRGRLYALRGDTERAASVLREAIAILAAVHGDEAAETAEARVALGGSLLDLGRFREARGVLEAAHAVLLRERDAEDPTTAKAAELLADAYQALGMRPEARALRR